MKTTANSTNKKLVFIPLSDLVKYEKAMQIDTDKDTCDIAALLPWGIALNDTEIQQLESVLEMALDTIEERAIAPLQKAFRDRPIVYQRELFQYNIDETTIQAFYESKERTIR